VVILANGGIAAEGTPEEVKQSSDPLVHQFVNALSQGPVKFHYPGVDADTDFGPRSRSGRSKGAR
jgi:phospholipid/cholesterol/gamma-HCH transport system ATP-binding protein